MSMFLSSSQRLLLPCLGPKEASGHDLDHHPLHDSQGPVERTSSLPQACLLYCPWARQCHRTSSAAGLIVAIPNLTKAVRKLILKESARPGYQQSPSKRLRRRMTSRTSCAFQHNLIGLSSICSDLGLPSL